MRFQEYLSEEAIIRELCRARIKHAAKRHDVQFFSNLDRHSVRPDLLAPQDWGNIPINIFPPRRAWHAFRPRNRGRKAPFTINVETLFRATIALRKTEPRSAWARNLARVIRSIQLRVLSNKVFRFKRPVIVPVRKDPKDPASRFYRPLSSFPLPEKIVECLTARYLRIELDHALLPSCIAFRAKCGAKNPPTTHDAIATIDKVRTKYKRLYVAECDIQGFFDCVSHEVARNALEKLIADAKLKEKIHPRAIEIFEAYLKCYSFERTVQRGKEMRALRKRRRGARAKWPRKELRELYGGALPPDIGIPQGGALSCFIANAVLHYADVKLEQMAKNVRGGFTYLRYCDDMILIAPARKVCSAVFRAYQDAVAHLRLPIHEPEDVEEYGRQFFCGKSNNPYLWQLSGGTAAVPWIQFLGYQLRRDGLLRVRAKSIDKHAQRITKLTDKLVRILDKGAGTGTLRRSAQQIHHRFHQKLISMSVGRIERGKKRKRPMPMCWASGFRMLAGRRFVTSNVRYLDHHRERQLRRVARRLKRLTLPPAKKQIAKEVLAYYGYPFSYIAQFR